MRNVRTITINALESGDWVSEPFSPEGGVMSVVATYVGGGSSTALTVVGAMTREADEYVDADMGLTLTSSGEAGQLLTGTAEGAMYAAWPYYKIAATVDDAAEITIAVTEY